MKQLILVTGAANCGKSEWAEYLATQMDQPVCYIATAQEYPDDLEWQERIVKHQQRRPKSWLNLSVTLELADNIVLASADTCLLIDSLGTWVANVLEDEDITWQQRSQQLISGLQQTTADVILVGEEVGWGVIPAYPSGRRFRERLGGLIREIGAIATQVYLVTGGYALEISKFGQSLAILNGSSVHSMPNQL